METVFTRLLTIIVALHCFACVSLAFGESALSFSRTQPDVDYFQEVQCIGDIHKQGRPDYCGRRVVDNIFSRDDIEKLHSIAEKGMSYRVNHGGPTILDINTGYIRDSAGLINLFAGNSDAFTDDDFSHYGKIIAVLKKTVMDTFKVDELYFTAPTFITRLDGNPDWQPKEMHDEYWHPHADLINTAHYHYSGLLYMSTYDSDFTGGKFKMIRPDFSLFGESAPLEVPVTSDLAIPTDSDVLLEVEPLAGRMVMFSAGEENLHYVERVTSGQRFVLSFWFTLDQKREFEIFLDGKAHTTFSHKVRDSHRQRQAAASAQKKKSSANKKKEL